MPTRVGMAVPDGAVPGTLDTPLVTNAVIRGDDHLQVIPVAPLGIEGTPHRPTRRNSLGTTMK
jgi:hypothetical protein